MTSTRPFKRVSDRRVRRELRRAAFHAALAARRARSVGPARAGGDRRVTRGFQRSTRHAARALSFSISPPPSHRVRNTVLLMTGAATTVVAVVAIRSKPWQSSGEAEPVADAAAAQTEQSETGVTPSSTANTGTESDQ
ncbi:MAG TPA: hypothetical protein VGQ45_08600 [Gaiellales bacterium]|jgi:hypothetical protein|nr:hypothetical protein [Gaiellales bacterium]